VYPASARHVGKQNKGKKEDFRGEPAGGRFSFFSKCGGKGGTERGNKDGDSVGPQTLKNVPSRKM